MQSLETDTTIEARFIPAWARAVGLLRCFLYRGSSMTPTFRSGHLLYVRPTARDITPGDVIVFAHPSENGYVVHRVVSITDLGLITRGDDSWLNDALPLTPDQVIGRVEMLEDQGHFKPVQGGRRGLWSARIGWGTRRVGGWLRRAFRAPYRALRSSPRVRRFLSRWLSRQLRVVRLETPDGPLIKVAHHGKVVACWRPGQALPQIRKPYDLFLSPDDLSPTRQPPPAGGGLDFELTTAADLAAEPAAAGTGKGKICSRSPGGGDRRAS